MNSRSKTLALTALAFVVANFMTVSTLDAQRGGRRRPAPQGEGEAKPAEPAAAEKPDDKKVDDKKTADKKPDKLTAYVGGTVHVGDGSTLRRATVLVKGSKIEAVGRDLEIPKEATSVDCTGKHLSPGFFMFDVTGVSAPRSVGKDEKYADGIDPFNPMIKRALASGITSYLASGGGGSPMGGTSAVVKLLPGNIEDVVIQEDVVYSMRVPLGAEGWRTFKKSIEDTKKFSADQADFEKKRAAGDKNAKPPQKPKDADILQRVLDGSAKVRVGGGGGGGPSRRMFGGGGGMTKPQILEALEVAKLIGHGIIIDSPAEAWLVADEIAATRSSCILKPRIHLDREKTRSDPHGTRIECAAILAKAGVPQHILPPGGLMGAGLGNGGILGRDLNTPTVDPCFAIRGGMPEDEALLTLTLYPAMMVGVEARIGSLEPGKDADLLILDGPPLHYRTFVETAIVHGITAYEKSREPFYKDLPSRQ